MWELTSVQSKAYANCTVEKIIHPRRYRNDLKDTFLDEIEQLSKGDEVVTYMNQIATCLTDLIEIYTYFDKNQIFLTLLDLHRESGEQELLLSFMQQIRDIERKYRRETILRGKEKAKEKGRNDGRPMAHKESTILLAMELLKTDTIKSVSEQTGIPYGTLKNYKRNYQKKNPI